MPSFRDDDDDCAGASFVWETVPKRKIFVSFFSSAFAYFCVSRFFFVQDFDQILRLVAFGCFKKRTLVSRDLSHTHTRA